MRWHGPVARQAGRRMRREGQSVRQKGWPVRSRNRRMWLEGRPMRASERPPRARGQPGGVGVEARKTIEAAARASPPALGGAREQRSHPKLLARRQQGDRRCYRPPSLPRATWGPLNQGPRHPRPGPARRLPPRIGRHSFAGAVASEAGSAVAAATGARVPRPRWPRLRRTELRYSMPDSAAKPGHADKACDAGAHAVAAGILT